MTAEAVSVADQAGIGPRCCRLRGAEKHEHEQTSPSQRDSSSSRQRSKYGSTQRGTTARRAGSLIRAT